MRPLVSLALVLVVAPAGFAQPPRTEVRRPVPICPGCDSVQQAIAVRRSTDLEIAGLTMGLARDRIFLEHLRSRLADGSPEPPTSETERRELQRRLDDTRAALVRTEARLEALCSTPNGARGYIGLEVLTGKAFPISPSAGASTAAYPVVWGVTPGSPASQAGVQPLDTIVAINGADARNRSLQTYLMHPGRRLTLRLHGAGAVRDVSIAVDSSPPFFGGACLHSAGPSVSTSRLVVRMDSVRRPTAVGVGAGAGASGAAAGRMSVSARTGERVLVRPDSAGQVMDFAVFRGGAVALSRGPSATIAGAQVFILNDGLKRTFDVTVDGALVLQVLPGTPAVNAGLASGDVIVRAGGRPVTTVDVFRRAVEEATGRNVELEIIRAREKRTLTLRW